jgi:hypothetical protein
MKLDPSILIKPTSKLFFDKYKYKIVLRNKSASWFRGNDLDHVASRLLNISPAVYWEKELSTQDRDYAEKLVSIMRQCNNYELRIESPLLSFYTNTEADIKKLSKIDITKVKYVVMPDATTSSSLDEHKVIVKRLDFGYKVSMGRTTQDFTSFVNWCNGNPKIRMPKRVKHDLSKAYSWGGGHFYVKDEKTLLMVKMFVGSWINKVEQVVKA